MSMPENIHMGRSWTGHPLEDSCSCPQQPCGLIAEEGALQDCPQHGWGAAKTMRQIHREEDCARITAELQIRETSREFADAGKVRISEIDSNAEGSNGLEDDGPTETLGEILTSLWKIERSRSEEG